jgi:hypothetical protein
MIREQLWEICGARNAHVNRRNRAHYFSGSPT